MLSLYPLPTTELGNLWQPAPGSWIFLLCQVLVFGNSLNQIIAWEVKRESLKFLYKFKWKWLSKETSPVYSVKCIWPSWLYDFCLLPDLRCSWYFFQQFCSWEIKTDWPQSICCWRKKALPEALSLLSQHSVPGMLHGMSMTFTIVPLESLI